MEGHENVGALEGRVVGMTRMEEGGSTLTMRSLRRENHLQHF